MRPTICRECYTIMEGSAWPLCDDCTQKRVTEAVATPLDIPVLWDDVPLVFDPEGKVYGSEEDVPVLPKYESSDDVPTVPTGTTPPLSALAPPKPGGLVKADGMTPSELQRKLDSLRPGDEYFVPPYHKEKLAPFPENIMRHAKRVPTMQERAAWFHHNQTTVADQAGRGPKHPSLLTRLWLLMCRVAARTEMALLRLL